jgi:iron complex outermembrane receptor protein
MYRKDSGFAPRKLILPAALASIFTLAGSPAWALGQDVNTQHSAAPVHFYDLKPGPLTQTLDAIASTSGRHIDFDRAALNGGHANAVHGNLSAGAAIAQALNGTTYVLNEDDAGTLVVTPSSQVLVTARRDQAETDFKADRSDTATRSGTSLHLVPGSVTLITGKVLETEQATNVTDALRNVSGVFFNQSPQHTTTFGIRGFQATGVTNGVTDSHATDRSVFSVERIEVLKGPQAILSGGDSLGGAVNIVVKKPQADTIRDLTLQYGSHGDKIAAVDLSGAVGSDKRLTYRTVASVDDADRNDVGMNGRDSKSIMQALRWKDRSTDLIVSADATREHDPLPRYTFARRDGLILPVPDRLLGNADDGFDPSTRRVGYQLEQQLTPNVVLISRAQLTHESFDLHVSSPAGLGYAKGAAPDSPLPGMSFYASRTKSHDETTSGDHYLRVTLATGDIRHKLSIGFNHTNYDYYQYQTAGDAVSVPVYSSTPYVFQDDRDRATTPSSDLASGTRQRAVYLQDLMSYDRWNLLLNVRRNRYTQDDGASTYYSAKSNFVFATPGNSSYHTTPGAGVVYQLNDQTALYASYAEGFVPSTAVQCGGGIVPPNETRNREAGAKFDLLDSQFTLTTAVFSMQQANSLLYDPINKCDTVRNAQRTRGGEIDAQGRLAPGLEAIFNYTYTSIQDASSATTVYAGQPRHKMNLWATYQFQSPALKGFGAGLGLSAKSWSLGNNVPTYQFIVPGGAQVDASLTYSAAPWNLTLGVKNVFDRTLYATTVGSSYVPLLPGREFALTVKRSFK